MRHRTEPEEAQNRVLAAVTAVGLRITRPYGFSKRSLLPECLRTPRPDGDNAMIRNLLRQPTAGRDRQQPTRQTCKIPAAGRRRSLGVACEVGLARGQAPLLCGGRADRSRP